MAEDRDSTRDEYIPELVDWLETVAGISPEHAESVALFAFSQVWGEGRVSTEGSGPKQYATNMSRLRSEALAKARVLEKSTDARVKKKGPVVKSPDMFESVYKGDKLERDADLMENRTSAEARNTLRDPTASDAERVAAGAVVNEDRMDNAREEGGFMNLLTEAADIERGDSEDIGAADLLDAMRGLYGFDPSDRDIERLEEAIIEYGDYRIPQSDDERVAIIGRELNRFANGDPMQAPALARAFGSVGDGVRRIRGQVRVRGKWIDYDPEVDPWLFGEYNSDGELAEPRRANSYGALGGEGQKDNGWEVGGWLVDPSLAHLEDEFLAIATEEDIDAPYLAAAIELLGKRGQLGWGEWTDEEIAVLTSGDREVSYKDEKSGTRIVHRYKENQGWMRLRGVETEIVGEKWSAAARRLGDAKSVKTQKGDRGVGAGSAIAKSREQRRAREDLAEIRKGLGTATQRGWAVRKSAMSKVKGWLGWARGVAKQAKAGEQRWGSQAGGLLSMVGGGLAEAYTSGRASGDQLYAIDEVFAQARYSVELANARSRNRIAARQAYRRYTEAWDNYYDSGGGGGGRRGGGGGGGGTVIKAVAKLPSEEDVKNSLTTLFRSWFRREPSDGEVAGVKKMLDGVIIHEANQAANAQAYGGSYEETDKEALILDYIRKSPEYQKLFAGKSEGQTEEEYANMFEQGATELFGQEMAQNDQAIRAGMLESREQTTLGYLAGTKAANESSTFQERLSKAAQIVAELT